MAVTTLAQSSSLPKSACRVVLNVPVGMLIGDTVLQSKRANFVVFKIFYYFQESVQEGSTLSLWEDTTSTCTALLEVTCCHMI